MAPKPFPYPLHVGIDVCSVSRLAKVLRNTRFRDLWARKVFTRLEWPILLERYRDARLAMVINAGKQIDQNMLHHDIRSPWMLPIFPSSILKPSPSGGTASGDPEHLPPPFLQLMRHLAGRWAAKEAVIKAYSSRPLYMREISIVVPSKQPRMYSAEFGKENRLIALIDPPTDIILMDEKVAKLRGLRGDAPRTSYLQQKNLLTIEETDLRVQSKTTGDQDLDGLPMEIEKEATYRRRRAKIDESQRQIAEVSISHEDDTAVAVCLASVEPGTAKEPKLIVDDGTSPPMHEPQWGDQGFLQFENNVKRLDIAGLARAELGSESSI